MQKFLIGFLFVIFTPICFAVDEYAAAKHETIYPSYPKIDYGSGSMADMIKRGEYLTRVGDCIACHTAPNGGQPFAGGYPIKTPFGTIFSPNITSDKETGIGGWTDEQFIKAMREGISPQGHYYYPAFPYPYFNQVNDEDLKAIKAYLDRLPPIHQVNLKNTMMFPLNWRFLQLGWRMLFFHHQQTGPMKTDPQQSAEWNRGAYLVQGLGHCSMCHTPSYYLFSEKYSLGAPIRKYDLTGAMVEGFFAPNITSTTLQDKTHQDLADVFLKDKLIGGGTVAGPMLEVNHDSLKYLSPEDIYNLTTYLKSVKSQIPPTPKKKANQTGLEQGKDIYDKYCTGCHTTGAGGAPKVGDMTAWDPILKLGLNNVYKNAIAGIEGMPPKGTCVTCTNQDIEYAVNYMVEQTKGTPGVSAKTIAPPLPPLSMADGKILYEKYCSVCHAPNANYLNTPKIGDQSAWAPRINQGMETLLLNTLRGVGNMPARGACTQCNDAQIKAAVKYLVQQSQTEKDYSLW